MKKVLILANNASGLYGFRNEVLMELMKKYEVHLALPDAETVPALEEEGCIIHHTPIDRRGMNPITDMKLMKLYSSIMDEVNPSCVMTYTIKPNVYGGMVCIRKRIPYVETITGLGTTFQKEGVLKKIAVFLYRRGIKNASCVFFQNQYNMDVFDKENIHGKKKKLVSGSGVNLEKFIVMDFPDDERIEFVFISRLLKEKGIDQYLDMAKYIKTKYPNTYFHICGECEDEYEEVIKEYENKDIIIYHGNVNDIREVLKDMQCVVHPSYYPEGMSNVLLEGAASGRAIITTDNNGCKEIVEDNINGYQIPQQDSQALIEAVEKFLNLSNEERKQMGLAGRRKVEREFDRRMVTKAYIDEIEEIIK